MPRLALHKTCQCCQFPCTRDAFFEEHNLPAILPSEYEDQCGCRPCCSYPNHVWTIVLAQLLTLVAFISTLAAAIDCRFVNGPLEVIDAFTIEYLFNNSVPEDVRANNATSRGVGFFAWEVMDGSCSYDFYTGKNYWNATNPEEEMNNDDIGVFDLYYTQLVGTDWMVPRTMAGISVFLAFIVLIWMFCFSCVAHKRRYRVILSFLLMIVLPLFQSLTFLVFRTDFCDVHDCHVTSGSYHAMAATITYCFVGVLLCFGTTNFPGNPYSSTPKGQRPPRCANLLCCRNTCLSFTERKPAEQSDDEMAASPTHHDHVMEVPVESAFFDKCLIHEDAAIPIAPAEIPAADRTTPAVPPPAVKSV